MGKQPVEIAEEDPAKVAFYILATLAALEGVAARAGLMDLANAMG